MTHHEKQIVALLGCSHALTHGYLLLLPPVVPLLLKEFSVGYFGIGVIGNILVLTYGLGALPGGIISDRLGPRKMYLACFCGSAVVSIMVSLSSDYVLFATGMALLGALGSVYHPLANSLISQKIESYGRAMGIHGAAGNVGIAATPILAGAIASFRGWRQSYVFFGLLGVALAIWSLFIDLSKTPQKTNISVPDTNSPRRGGLMATFFPLPLVLIYLTNMLNAFCFQGTITFLPTYMAHQTTFQVFSLDNVAIGGMLSGIVLFIGVAGQYMGGVLGGKARLERNLALIGALAFPFLLAMSFQRDVLLLIAALGYYFLNFCMQPMCNVLVARYTTAETRGTAFGIFFFIASGAGSFSATFAGYLAQRFGLASIFQGMCAALILLFIMAFLLFRVTKIKTATPPWSKNGPPSPNFRTHPARRLKADTK